MSLNPKPIPHQTYHYVIRGNPQTWKRVSFHTLKTDPQLILNGFVESVNVTELCVSRSRTWPRHVYGLRKPARVLPLPGFHLLQ